MSYKFGQYLFFCCFQSRNPAHFLSTGTSLLAATDSDAIGTAVNSTKTQATPSSVCSLPARGNHFKFSL
jgi:hypothetical protein